MLLTLSIKVCINIRCWNDWKSYFEVHTHRYRVRYIIEKSIKSPRQYPILTLFQMFILIPRKCLICRKGSSMYYVVMSWGFLTVLWLLTFSTECNQKFPFCDKFFSFRKEKCSVCLKFWQKHQYVLSDKNVPLRYISYERL